MPQFATDFRWEATMSAARDRLGHLLDIAKRNPLGNGCVVVELDASRRPTLFGLSNIKFYIADVLEAPVDLALKERLRPA
jgi:hypothetical protein